MSGLVGIVNFDGAPIDDVTLRRMMSTLQFRGPDRSAIKIQGSIGFGHALLKTTEESEREDQPYSLDGNVWIVADARIDARTELIAAIGPSANRDLAVVPDVELILHAYHKWGEDCVKHLLGDFAFGVWDGPRQCLFCARDHLGVRPFYYSIIRNGVVFSNTLDCLRQHPQVSSRLNDLAVADYLIFDLNQENATTIFADIQRIPPAHSMTWSSDSQRTQRYWTLPVDDPIHYHRNDDYVDHFKELMRACVKDRLRTNRVSIFLSGGLDSSALAASACELLHGQPGGSSVRGYTMFCEGFDSDRAYAKLVGEHLQIPIAFRDTLAEGIDPNWDKTSFHTPEPEPNPLNLVARHRHFRLIAGDTRVALYGEGPDNALRFEWRPYLSYLANRRLFGRLVSAVSSHVLLHRRIPFITTLPRMVRERRNTDQLRSFFPDWLDQGFESRLRLRDRWLDQDNIVLSETHPVRPKAYQSFHTPLWSALFEDLDAQKTRVPLEIRQPFLDVRLLRYLLALPAVPWCRVKYILRRAMRGVLPETVRRRPKSSVEGDPIWEQTRRSSLPSLIPAAQLRAYIDIERFENTSTENQVAFWINFRPRSLNYWLQNLQ